MENEYIQPKESPFAFLEEKDTQDHFANLNIELLRGAHIQKDNYYLFQLLSNHEPDLHSFYKTFYGLNLVSDKYDNEVFFYLDLYEESKGKLYPSSRHRELSEGEVVIAIMLLNMYYDRYFEHSKEIQWSDIRKEILEGENSALYKKLIFNDVRDEYSDPEWEGAKKNFKRTLRDLSVLGWIKRLSNEDSEDIHFSIKESIHRFAKLYATEINSFDEFVTKYRENKAEK